MLYNAVKQYGYELVPQPPYSPYLAPSDYHLFGNLKKHPRGRKPDDDKELTGAAEGWFRSQRRDFYLRGIDQMGQVHQSKWGA